MVNSISKQEIMDAVEKAKEYFTPILAPKTVGYYKNVWNKLVAYADASPDKSNVDIKVFYGMVTHTEAYTRPDTRWLRTQARAVLSLLDIHSRLRNARTHINTGFFLLQNKTTPHWSVV